MSRMGNGRVHMPKLAKRGDIVEIRAMVQHPMESGFRLDDTGKPIARHIVTSFTCHYAGREVLTMRLHPAVSVNPYLTFCLRATESGELTFTWSDDQGGVAIVSTRLDVVS
jgi:sulfur-oxidizing protein SoxZ